MQVQCVGLPSIGVMGTVRVCGEEATSMLAVVFVWWLSIFVAVAVHGFSNI